MTSPSARFKFTPNPPTEWEGRYARIPGRATVFHVRRGSGGWWPVIDWTIGDDRAECKMVANGDTPALVESVLAGKRALRVPAGGAFMVNEFGRVLVPASDTEYGTRIMLVGECSGPVVFENPFDGAGATFDLADHTGMRRGDRWERPYVGIPHNLSAADELYFKLQTPHGTVWDKPPVQDDSLIEALRSLRPYGPVRFIVTVGGLVATKVEVAPEVWEPHYVGRITRTRWFKKEG
jgi:hypothetical protein